MASTDLAVITAGTYLSLNHEIDELFAPFRENLGDDTLSKFDLDKATVPGPGGSRWKITKGDGTTDDPPSISGVIIAIANTRAYYSTPFTSGGDAPDCASHDGGRTGVGDPGGVCSTCPLNEFGSAREGDGKACGESKDVLLLTKDAVLPMLVSVPSVSLKNFKGYMSSLAGIMLPAWKVETEMMIGKRNTSGRADVPCIVCRRVGNLDPDEAARAKQYADAIDSLISGTPSRAAAPQHDEAVPATVVED